MKEFVEEELLANTKTYRVEAEKTTRSSHTTATVPVDSIYEPIFATEFRVIHILPGEFNDDIQCVLEKRSGEVKTRYDALSYEWGDASTTKPIRLARLDYPSRPTTTGVISTSLRRTTKVVQTLTTKFATPLRILNWSLGTGLLWYFMDLVSADVPSWASWLLSRNVYIFLLCMLCGEGPMSFLVKFFMLISEAARTKPWLLVYEYFRSRGSNEQQWNYGQSLGFQTLQVTENLALALRYLRQKRRPRTLWVDALCICQKNEDEKKVQIQQMDRLYANASHVVVWLGAYHGISEADICDELLWSSSWLQGVECKHSRQIQAAFRLIQSLIGWRLLIPHGLSGWDTAKLFREGRLGLREISRRGWWERLWVIQEVALATGRVQIQCGHSTCDFNDYHSAHVKALIDHAEDKELKEDSGPSECMLTIIEDFRYSSFYDQQKVEVKLFHGAMKKLFGLMSDETENDLIERFQKQPFAQRLQQVLLRTAGHFRCRDDQDRLYAVLGISGGSKKGKAVVVSGFMEFISSHSTHIIFLRTMTPLLEASASTLTRIILGIALSSWSVFYGERAKHWTFNRPEYVVNRYEEIIDAVTYDPSGQRRNRVEFFTALARYISTENKSLAFLDVANCGEDQDQAMPSWVPNWTRELSAPAFKLVTQTRKADEAPAVFQFLEDGKTLVLLGRAKGKVHVVRSTDPEHPRSASSVRQELLESWFALPNELKKAMVDILTASRDMMRQAPMQASNEAEQKLKACVFILLLVCLKLGSMLLQKGGRTLVYSLDAKAGQEIGFLKAGKAARGDQLVSVPGCFHHLVLRRRKPTEAGARWKLVGLVSMSTQPKYDRVCSKSEWTKLRQDGAIFKFSIG
ncbi:hypothetical protein H2198_008672 [Neophaeococcomyces mojaviensis]|uniref:Uncharacterized protein n=1 Tax=Neophaeococcomyces mojaviensis TaxID=3383035 RepID=A0ACC2ZWU7_9EURO|nr:hypothetical protein H2198_008672 [Knufia sp. JES_112]